ncbi:c-type cytochrome biogenesis protein CcmI [Jannaschia sp. LMIT008]|uniref:c-type cytochrome biogenesis protein CcmI n=1 Tax=Jannaschia maritima TaxID=3032585 RepID=UPI0028118ACD|nr:c-type cytochrome biogenesis protein CcmI [Jannaschia sp. LMIT008]
MAFWIVAASLTAACIALLWQAVRTPPAGHAPDVDVYRDQLRELDRDRDRGTLPDAEAEAARIEVARRLLAADRNAAAGAARTRGNRTLAGLLTAFCVAAVAGATYWTIGAPGYPDMPLATRIDAIEAARAARPGQAVAQAEVPDLPVPDDADPQTLAMVERLREVLAVRPDDLEGWTLAARFEAALGQHEAAWRAQDRVVALKGDGATAADFAALAEGMILAAGGYVSPEAERALAAALERDPGEGLARYYVGLMYAQGGRPDLAWPLWRRLIGDSEPDAPWLPAIYDQIERVSFLAGDVTPLDELPRPRGPTAEDIDAMSDLGLEERMDMIAGMVDGLSARLATEGGPPSDWARLITSYGVLGNANAALAIYDEARRVFADSPAALDTLFRAAEQAGVAGAGE